MTLSPRPSGACRSAVQGSCHRDLTGPGGEPHTSRCEVNRRGLPARSSLKLFQGLPARCSVRTGYWPVLRALATHRLNFRALRTPLYRRVLFRLVSLINRQINAQSISFLPDFIIICVYRPAFGAARFLRQFLSRCTMASCPMDDCLLSLRFIPDPV